MPAFLFLYWEIDYYQVFDDCAWILYADEDMIILVTDLFFLDKSLNTREWPVKLGTIGIGLPENKDVINAKSYAHLNHVCAFIHGENKTENKSDLKSRMLYWLTPAPPCL